MDAGVDMVLDHDQDADARGRRAEDQGLRGHERGLPGVRDATRLVQGNGRAHVPRPGAARRVRGAGARRVAPTAGTGRCPPSPHWARWA